MGVNALARLITVLLPVGLVLTGCGGEAGAPQAGPTTTTVDELELGERVYAENCSRCHGPQGGGGVGPRLADGRVVKRYPNPDDHRKVVVEGRGAMPAWGLHLSDEEIDAVVRYERERL